MAIDAKGLVSIAFIQELILSAKLCVRKINLIAVTYVLPNVTLDPTVLLANSPAEFSVGTEAVTKNVAEFATPVLETVTGHANMRVPALLSVLSPVAGFHAASAVPRHSLAVIHVQASVARHVQLSAFNAQMAYSRRRKKCSWPADTISIWTSLTATLA